MTIPPQAAVQPGHGESLFRAVFASSQDAILIIDPRADRIVDANPRAVELLGYSRDELLTLPVSAVHPQEMDRLLAFTERVYEQGRGWTDELGCTTKQGCQVPSEISASVLSHDGARLVVAIVRDVSERRRMETELRRANETLEERVAERTASLEAAQRELVQKERLAALGTFASGIVHELRNPLGTIGMALDYALAAEPAPATAKRLTLAQQETRRLGRLLEDILSYSRPQALERAAVDMVGLVEESTRVVAGDTHDDGPPIHLEAPPTLSVMADGDKLRQVFINLLRNAREAAPPGTPVEAVVEAGDGDVVTVRVHNGGEPIPPEILSRLGDPFVSAKPGGTGLGLAIARRLVEAHGGTLDITSTPSAGTTVKVDLPCNLGSE